ncbi:hypothetical protein MANES_09G166250v8 [Manihot esculenta]|uniref:Uncharacterized protein n=1 Tax=Manihot esculenta TaxID=3983 RepID=A0A2C9VBF4_MANES|nr:hypothetical protein MANES_09G166250v8 [Manihot esculenta]
MFLSNGKVGGVLLILLILSAFQNGEVVEANRSLKEMVTQIQQQASNNNNNNNTGGNGFAATVNRAVPSCPDPLHNK